MTILASGQLKIVPTTIFEVGGADVLPFTQAIVRKCTFFNTDSMVHTVRLSVTKFSGQSRILEQFEIKKEGSADYLKIGGELELDNGDRIEAEATADDVVDFAVIGVRE